MNGQHGFNASADSKICDKNVSTTTVVSRPAQNNDHQPSYSASRWNPTAQQLLALEEIYRLGTRTPTAEEIQQITQQLRRFGKIEAKNVFYWFQNHKARERMKRRRQIESCDWGKTQNRDRDHESNEYKKELGLRKTVNRDEQAKNCNFKHSEGFVPNSMHKATNAKWLTKTSRTSKLINLESNKSPSVNYKKDNTNVKNEIKEIEILELFPLCSSSTDTGGCDGGTNNDIKVPIRAINTNLRSNQFFEFLPLKN